MTVFIRPEFTPGTLLIFNGYHLQIFGSGRAKISLQTGTNKKQEFFAARPKKDRAAYQRQKARSLAALPDHYAAVDQLLFDNPDAKVFRIHAKGDNNATADNAHLLASLEQASLWLIMSGVVHQWELITMLTHVLLEGKGKRKGEASIFNEYMPSFEHDWQDAEFELDHYKVCSRVNHDQIVEVPQPSPAKRSAPKIENKSPIQPRLETALDCVLDNSDEDPVLFTDPPYDPPNEPFPHHERETVLNTKALTGGTAYGKTGLWAAYTEKFNRPG